MKLILVPCKSLAFGKSRLAPLLDRNEREKLCQRLLLNTLRLAVEVVSDKANVKLVSPDPAAQEIAGRMSLESFTMDWPDLNSTLDGVRERVVREGYWREVLILPIDLPFATQAALRNVMADDADVTIVPDRKDEGTNVLMLRDEALAEFQFAYGDASFIRHCETALSRGWKLSIKRIAELAFDIDDPADYREWSKSPAVLQQAMSRNVR